MGNEQSVSEEATQVKGRRAELLQGSKTPTSVSVDVSDREKSREAWKRLRERPDRSGSCL